MKERVYNSYIGGRTNAVSGDAMFISTYNAEDILVICRKMDPGVTGGIGAETFHLKPYTYDVNMQHNDVPSSYYEFRKSDILNGTVAHEGMSGLAVTVTNNGVLGGNTGAVRYGSQFGMLAGTAVMTDNGAHAYLSAAENSAQSWSYETWINRVASSAACTIYIESNAGVTNYLQLQLSAAGVASITHSGVTAWTAPTAIPLGTWTHLGLTFNVGAGTIQQFMNGLSSGAGSAYARLASWLPTFSSLNFGAANQIFLSQSATYQNVVLGAADYKRHYDDLTTDTYSGVFGQTTTNLGQYGTAGVMFSNNGPYGFDSTTYMLRMPMAPIVAVYNLNGIYLAEVTERQREGGA